VRVLRPHGFRRGVFGAGIAIVLIGFVAVAYEYEQAPRLTRVSCRWEGSAVAISGEIHNPSVFDRSYAIVPRVAIAGASPMGGARLFISVPAGATLTWGDRTEARDIAPTGTRIRACSASANPGSPPTGD
jgi:hypothetical protein